MGKISEFISRAYGIEESIVGDAPKITAVGNGSVYIENHGGLLSYGENTLSLMSGVSVEGENIRIESMDADSISIGGKISGIKIERNLKNC